MNKKVKEEKSFLIFGKTIFKNPDVGRNLLILATLFLLSTLIIMLFSIYVVQSMLANSYQGEKIRQEKFYYWISKVEEFPNSPDVLYNAAVTAISVGKNETALKLLNKAIEYDPQFTEAKDLRGELINEIY